MASPREEQDKLLSYLDGIMACIENYPLFNLETPFLDSGMAVNAMALLMKLLGKFYTQEEIIEWLCNFLVYTLPALEIGIKGVILSNLKLSISCNIDPWIPEEWRQHMFGEDKDEQTLDENPCLIPVSTIDYRNILQINPVSKRGQEYYYKTNIEYTHKNPTCDLFTFKSDSYAEVYEAVLQRSGLGIAGNIFYKPEYIKQTGDIASIYQLARADDMNAFIWFVMNKGVYLSANRTNLSKELPINAVTSSLISYDGSGTCETEELSTNGIELYTSGDIVSTKTEETENNQINSNNYLICYDGQKTVVDKGKSFSYYYHLVPCSNRQNSYNWYVNRKNYGKMLIGKDFDRDYKDEFPLFNMSCKGADGKTTNNPSINSYLQIKVLPKPMLHYNNRFWIVDKLEENGVTVPIPFKKILFNEKGEPDKKGRFTVKPKMIDGKIYRPTGATVDVQTSNGKTKTKIDYPYTYQICDANGNTDKYKLVVNKDGYQIELNDAAATGDTVVNDCLFPCYPGLTVYEFNYDFVMGMRLFDPKTVAYRIFKTLMEFRLGLPRVSMSETMYQMRISEIIKNIIESDAYEVSDCFFNFSNEKFASMLNEAEKRRAQQYPFADDEHRVEVDGQEVIDILNEYKDTASKTEQTDTFKRAFTQATANITQEVLPEDKLNIGMDFILEAVKVLGITLFETIISPKMLLLFEVNRRLMGETSEEYPDIETLLKQLASMITAIIAEIMETIIAEIMAFLMKKIGEILAKLAAMLTLEQLTFYKELIEKLIKACSFSFPLFGHRANLDSQIDVVQYADIDVIDTPKTDEC